MDMEDYNAIRAPSNTEVLNHSGPYKQDKTIVLVRTLAAAFWTSWSLFIKRAEKPPQYI